MPCHLQGLDGSFNLSRVRGVGVDFQGILCCCDVGWLYLLREVEYFLEYMVLILFHFLFMVGSSYISEEASGMLKRFLSSNTNSLFFFGYWSFAMSSFFCRWLFGIDFFNLSLMVAAIRWWSL